MHCLICNQRLQPTEIAEGLRAHACKEGHGVWLPLSAYTQWKATRPHAAPQGVELDEVDDRATAASCPCCARLMQKYRVSSRFEFRIDRCSACQAVWFDTGEWNAVLALGLDGNLIKILSDGGQREIRQNMARERIEQQWRERLGAETFAELMRISAWLNAHPQRAQMLAYLNGRA